MIKQFLLNIPEDDWNLIKLAMADQTSKTKWMVHALRQVALARLPESLRPEGLEKTTPMVLPPPTRKHTKPWIHLGPYTEPEEIVRLYSRSALIDWADEHRQTWREMNDLLMPVKVRYALDGQPYVRPAMVQDNGAWRIATPAEIEAMTDEQRAAEEAKGCVLPPRKAAAPALDDWA